MLGDSKGLIAVIVLSGCFAEPAATTSAAVESSSTVGPTSTDEGASATAADADASVDTTTSGVVDGSSEASSSAGTTGAVDCIDAPAGMVAWWRADDDFLDAVGSNHGTPMGGATLSRDGRHGGAMQLDGIDGAVALGNGAALHFGLADFTIEAWVRLDGTTAPRGTTSTMPGDLTIASKMVASTSANADGWRLFKQQDDQFWFCFGSVTNGCGALETTTVHTAAGSPVPGAWVHLAALHEAGEIRIYLGGVLEDSKTMVGAVNSDSAALYLGASTSEPGDPPVNAFLYGALDDVTLYDRALGDDEIVALATASSGKCEP